MTRHLINAFLDFWPILAALAVTADYLIALRVVEHYYPGWGDLVALGLLASVLYGALIAGVITLDRRVRRRWE